jgi:hypothetical protein
MKGFFISLFFLIPKADVAFQEDEESSQKKS